MKDLINLLAFLAFLSVVLIVLAVALIGNPIIIAVIVLAVAIGAWCIIQERK